MPAPIVAAVGKHIVASKAKDAATSALSSGNETTPDKLNANEDGAPRVDPSQNNGAFAKNPHLEHNVKNTVGRIMGMPDLEIANSRKMRESLSHDRDQFIGAVKTSNGSLSELTQMAAVVKNGSRLSESVDEATPRIDSELKAGAFDHPIPNAPGANQEGPKP